VLATNGRAGIILFAVAADLFEHLRVDFKLAPLGQEVERLTTIQVVVELAMRPETGERPAMSTRPRSHNRRKRRCVTSSLPPARRTICAAEQNRYRKTASMISRSDH
jgi:hypothetical protein